MGQIFCMGVNPVLLTSFWADPYLLRVSKRMTRFQIIISNNENVLQLQNKLQTIK